MKEYIHYGTLKFDKEKFKKVENMNSSLAKPSGGFWGSPIDTPQSWKRWCEKEDFGECKEDNAMVFKLTENAKVLEINSLEDLKQVEDIATKEIFCGIQSYNIDFEKLSERYDAMEISLTKDWDLYYALYGWDCDSILIMNPDIVVQIDKEINQETQYDTILENYLNGNPLPISENQFNNIEDLSEDRGGVRDDFDCI